MVDEHAQAAASEDLGKQHLDLRLALGQAPLDICLKGCHQLSPHAKKAGVRPLPVLLPASPHRHESC
jgi:hypothetical protein